ncbi:MAG: phosphopantetheine-binding protein [Actinomycetota bacterium]|nr:phosphopantetheine-binding protein [Actinomycetota bacterium]
MTAPDSSLRPVFEQVLRRHLRLVAGDEPIPFDAELVAIGIDSMDSINLLVDIEETFGISFPGALLTVDTFRTPATLESAVAGLLAGSR